MPSIYVPGKSTKREWSVYIIVARPNKNAVDSKTCYLYVGKVGDNREGCNPIVSRLGNHFSFNKKHSQLRNKIFGNTTSYDYTYFYKHLKPYNKKSHRGDCDWINEMERELNRKLQNLLSEMESGILLNPYKGRGVNKAERLRRKGLLAEKDKVQLNALLTEAFQNFEE